MPTVAVDKEELWERLGHKYCTCLRRLGNGTVDEDCFSQLPRNSTACSSNSAWSLMRTCVAVHCARYIFAYRVTHSPDYRGSRGFEEAGLARGTPGACHYLDTSTSADGSYSNSKLKSLPTGRLVLYITTRQHRDRRFRYDLLCIEGIARALRVFLGKDRPPVYKLVYPASGENALVTTRVAPEACVPPLVSGDTRS